MSKVDECFLANSSNSQNKNTNNSTITLGIK